jgi:aryl-alcohol dehydrogenase-like predicted oxidoreductase
MTTSTQRSTFTLGGDLPVRRLGYGSMQLTGPGVWGEPADRPGALAVLRRAVELGVDFIDTADSYGPFVAEDLIREALHPYDGVRIATKAGLVRHGPGIWEPVGRPAYLRAAAEMSLRRLGVERIDLFQLHRVDPAVPLAEQVGVLADLQTEGKIHHVGLSEVSVDQLEQARRVVEVASVQNLYNLTNRSSEAVLDHCEAQGIAFIPWFPVATGRLAEPGGPLAELSAASGHTPAQLALAWLLRRSPVVLPIPGTRSLAHLAENVAAADVVLDEDLWLALSRLAGS